MLERVQVRDRFNPSAVTKIVTKASAKRTKMRQSQKTEIVAILRLAKGFSCIFY